MARFDQPSEWQAGIAAWYALIRGPYVGRWGLKTLDAIARRSASKQR